MIPAAYDLDDGWFWRLPGTEPWGDRYVAALAELMKTVTKEEVRARREAVPADLPLFDLERQQSTVVAFVQEAFDAWRDDHRVTASA
jgi:hypothetical protein